jgi:hypothetical protein
MSFSLHVIEIQLNQFLKQVFFSQAVEKLQFICLCILVMQI